MFIPEDIIQFYWFCKCCNNKNPGGASEDEGLRCIGCGNQRTDEPYVAPDDIENAPAVTDSKMLNDAAHDLWVCNFCRYQERSTHTKCSACGYSKDEHPTDNIKPVIKSNPFESFYESPPVEFKKVSIASKITIGAVIFLAIALISWLCYYFFSSHNASAKIKNVSWETTVQLEELHTKKDSDWKDDMHSGAYDIECENKFKKNVNCNPYDCNPHDAPYDCNCSGGKPYKCNCKAAVKDNGNGYGTRGKECEICYTPKKCETCKKIEYDTCYKQCPVYEDYCSYKYDIWEVINTKTLSGNNNEPIWAELLAEGNKQRIDKSQHYKINYVNTSDLNQTWCEETSDTNLFKLRTSKPDHKIEWSRSGLFTVIE